MVLIISEHKKACHNIPSYHKLLFLFTLKHRDYASKKNPSSVLPFSLQRVDFTPQCVFSRRLPFNIYMSLLIVFFRLIVMSKGEQRKCCAQKEHVVVDRCRKTCYITHLSLLMWSKMAKSGYVIKTFLNSQYFYSTICVIIFYSYIIIPCCFLSTVDKFLLICQPIFG